MPDFSLSTHITRRFCLWWYGFTLALARAMSLLSPLGVTVGCPWPGLFSRFRSIFVKMPHDCRIISSHCDRAAIHDINWQLSCHYAGYEKSIFTFICVWFDAFDLQIEQPALGSVLETVQPRQRLCDRSFKFSRGAGLTGQSSTDPGSRTLVQSLTHCDSAGSRQGPANGNLCPC